MSELTRFEKVFEGSPITAYLWEDKPVWVAKELGRVMGYGEEGKGLLRSIQDWKEQMIAGVDFEVLEGEQLAKFKATRGELLPESDRSPSLLILKESGFHLVCLKTDKPIGVRLRRWLAEEVMPSLVRTGSYPSKAQTLEDLRPAAMLGLQKAAEKGHKWAIQMVLAQQSGASPRSTPLLGGKKYVSKFVGFFEQPGPQEVILKNFGDKWFFAIDLVRALDATKPFSDFGWSGATAKSLGKYLSGAVSSAQGFAPYRLESQIARSGMIVYRMVKP